VSFKDRVAVVTGASSGIGAALSLQLAAAGARVGLLALPGPALESVAAEIADGGGQAVAISADVTDLAAVTSALDQFARELGPVDLLILSAGVSLVMGVEAFSATAVERMFRVNLLGVVHAIEAVMPSMMARRSGHLVVVSSLSSSRGIPALSAYCASKSAVDTLMDGLRIELRYYDIDVTTVRPGFVTTPMTAGQEPGPFAQEAPAAAQRILAGIAARRAEVNFPWQPAAAARIARWLPTAVYDRLMTAALDRARARASRETG